MQTKRQIAEKIADLLFGHGEIQANRLILVKEKSPGGGRVTNAIDLGGWSKGAVIDRIIDVLNDLDQKSRPA
jgi:hypothetical protein